jgi:hypothetical protein
MWRLVVEMGFAYGALDEAAAVHRWGDREVDTDAVEVVGVFKRPALGSLAALFIRYDRTDQIGKGSGLDRSEIALFAYRLNCIGSFTCRPPHWTPDQSLSGSSGRL